MTETVQCVVAWLVGQPLSWPLALLPAFMFGRAVLQQVTFLCGLHIAVRGSQCKDRAGAVRAYAACVAAQRTWRGRA